nr:MAG: putative ATPase of the ABC class [Bacteriophage sp.]
MPFAKSRSRPDRSQRKAKLHKKIVSTNYAVPTGNLDSQNSSEVIALLKETSKKYEQTIIMITHNRSIAQTADRVLQVSDGTLTDFGRCRE